MNSLQISEIDDYARQVNESRMTCGNMSYLVATLLNALIQALNLSIDDLITFSSR
jgi:hypothetical protein